MLICSFTSFSHRFSLLSRADIGITMGAMGSDAAIEAADIVLMDDDPIKIAKAIRLSGFGSCRNCEYVSGCLRGCGRYDSCTKNHSGKGSYQSGKTLFPLIPVKKL